MSESTPTSNTGTVKSKGEEWQDTYGRAALEVRVLTLKTLAVQTQVRILTEPPFAVWFTEEEIGQLRKLWDTIGAAADATAEWEKSWRARLVSSRKS